jgi:hypothetical protein
MKYWIDEQTGCKMCEPNCVDEWLQFIWDIGCDYDGYSDANNLKQLIDELVNASIQARECLHKGELFAKEMMTEHINKEKCAKCTYHDAFWDGSECNLLNNMEPCKFEPKDHSDGSLLFAGLEEIIDAAD